MKSSDFLFRLIKSLSKGDRRNLKLYGRLQDGDKKYLQLFDAIDAQEDYDEAAIIKQFEGERFLNQFSVAKNYLYNYILKTLHIFHKDQHAELAMIVHQVEILMSKNLYQQAHKLARKARHIAEKQERFQELLTVLDNERKIMNYMQRSAEYAIFIKDIAESERKAISAQDNLLKYQHVVDEVYVLTRTLGKQPRSRERIREILNLNLITDPSMAGSLKAKIKRLGIMVDCNTYLGNLRQAYDLTREVISLYRSNEEICREWNAKYILILANLGVLSYQLGMVEQAFAALRDLREAKVYSHEESVRVFERYYMFKISLCIETGNVEEGIEAIADFEQESRALDGHLQKAEELSVFYVSAYLLITAGQYSAALQWVNKLLNEPRTELRTDLQCAARILAIVIHLELGNHDLIEYMVKAAVRFIGNRGQLLQVERISLKYLKKLSDFGVDQKEGDILLAFKSELIAVLSDPAEKKSLSLFDMTAWIDAKLAGQTMAEHFRGEFLQKVGAN